MRRVFVIVLDSCGCGALPDAAAFSDAGTHTLRSCWRTGQLAIPNLLRAGLGRIEGLEFLPRIEPVAGAYGRMAEASCGKDTTVGHWELAGLVSPAPLPTYPNGFDMRIIDAFSRATGRGVLANRPYSGTKVIEDYGAEHMKTGALIVYTSADSVFQIAAHEDVVPPELLYEYCRAAREILQGKDAVGRVIARPFTGEPGAFVRTANRRDFSLAPPGPTMLDAISAQGLDVIAVGKINDIFAGRGVTRAFHTADNRDGMDKTAALARQDFHGLCFINLVDFDMRYGHRRDAAGYARALSEFDRWLGGFLPLLGRGDLLLLTADHGCDPDYTATTDHTREYVPLLALGPCVQPMALGTARSFCTLAATVCAALEVPLQTQAESLLRTFLRD